MSVVLHGIAAIVTVTALVLLLVGEVIWWGTCLAIATVLLNAALMIRDQEIR